SADDLQLFSVASGDRNPLHLSDEYARRTPYGERVVFGALGALAALRDYDPSPHRRAVRIEAEFLRPMFLRVNYRLETATTQSEYRARLFDGSIPVFSLVLKMAPEATLDATAEPAGAVFERSEAALHQATELREGLSVKGTYRSDPSASDGLRRRWSISAEPFLVEVLTCSSFLAGMEIPGEAALFSKIGLDLEGYPREATLLEYRVRVRSVNPRTSQLRMELSLETGGTLVAAGEYVAFVRDPAPLVAPTLVESPDRLTGKVALVIGASRGLGAATAYALEARGAIVYMLSRSAAEGPDARAERGDASDSRALERIRDRISADHSLLDILVCNACPPILPLRLEPEFVGRIGDYVASALAMTLAPICAFSSVLHSSGGTLVVVSSAAVEQPVRDWPHYLAAKSSVES